MGMEPLGFVLQGQLVLRVVEEGKVVFRHAEIGDNEMTNTKELLELAAKACGIEWDQRFCCFYVGRQQPWNPATDDGDCARMEAALNLNIVWREDIAAVGSGHDGGYHYEVYEDHNNDRQAARRMASLRCAADIQKARES